MRTKFIKYGRSVKTPAGHESLEISIELEPHEYEEEAFHRAKRFVEKKLQIRGLTATIGEIIKPKAPTTDSPVRQTEVPPPSQW